MSGRRVVTRTVLTGLLSVCAGQGLLAQSAPVEWTALTVRLSQAADNGNLVELRGARAAALRVVVAPMTGVAPPIALYTVAYADYRLATDQRTPGAEQQGFADEAEEDLREVIGMDNRFADACGLLSAVLGLKIAWAASTDAKVALGPESGASLNRGLSLEPNNSRLLIIQGLGLFRRPAEYGGDPGRAEALFRRAADALDTAREAPWPNWGRFDAHVWLGQALAKRGDIAGARAEYTKALAIAPASSWVKDILLPAIGRRVSDTAPGSGSQRNEKAIYAGKAKGIDGTTEARGITDLD
jgi:tetratricopeptide (TPR) repeat protein